MIIWHFSVTSGKSADAVLQKVRKEIDTYDGLDGFVDFTQKRFRLRRPPQTIVSIWGRYRVQYILHGRVRNTPAGSKVSVWLRPAIGFGAFYLMAIVCLLAVCLRMSLLQRGTPQLRGYVALSALLILTAAGATFMEVRGAKRFLTRLLDDSPARRLTPAEQFLLKRRRYW